MFNLNECIHRVVAEEDVAPLVLDEEEAVGEDEDHGEHDHQHHHQPAVQVTHRNQILVLGNKYYFGYIRSIWIFVKNKIKLN